MILHVALRDAIYVEGRTGVYKVPEEHISPAILQVYTVQGGHRTLPTFQQFWQIYCNLVEFVTEFCGQFDANLHFTELIAKIKSGIRLFQTFEKYCDFLSDSPFKKQK